MEGRTPMPQHQPADRLADSRNLEAVARSLHRRNAEHRGDWTLDGGGLVRELRSWPAERRVRLLVRLSEALEETAVHAPPECRGLAALNVLLAQGLSAQQLAPWREPLLAEAAGRLALWEGWRLTALVETELAAGRHLPDAVVATVRRSAVLASDPAELPSLARQFTEPPVNPGEPWADRALADLAAAGPGARARRRELLAHAATATGARPTAKWLRAGQPLVDAVGPERLRTAAAEWFALTGEPRRDAVASFHRSGPALHDPDPFNWRVLQGLAALLTLTPPHPDTARALATLAGTALIRCRGLGPRSPRTAAAAIRALTTLGGPDARTELERLAGTLTHKPTLKAITTALTTWNS
ncbi:hypothetical protein EDD38_5945 [Kitasatospora cineracea]|uniref:Uncharacterized protein n=2 Tax=Kitasatospora cineracea TaxID=88074 RepID=A0A3N4RDN1_9ACTN|nr:hypothetical protein EDD38_5945 [Kitasatospora cineracea]